MTHSEPGFAKPNVADGRAQLQRLATDSWSRNTSLTAARDRGRAWRDQPSDTSPRIVQMQQSVGLY